MYHEDWHDKMMAEFVPYEQAVALKELGFDEPCFYPYLKLTQRMDSAYVNFKDWNNDYPGSYSAPLYRQAFGWFRKKHGLNHWIREDEKGKFSWVVYRRDGWAEWTSAGMELPTYEMAELACMNKLIELVGEK